MIKGHVTKVTMNDGNQQNTFWKKNGVRAHKIVNNKLKSMNRYNHDPVESQWCLPMSTWQQKELEKPQDKKNLIVEKRLEKRRNAYINQTLVKSVKSKQV